MKEKRKEKEKEEKGKRREGQRKKRKGKGGGEEGQNPVLKSRIDQVKTRKICSIRPEKILMLGLGREFFLNLFSFLFCDKSGEDLVRMKRVRRGEGKGSLKKGKFWSECEERSIWTREKGSKGGKRWVRVRLWRGR